MMPTALMAFTVLFVLAVLAADQVEGRHKQPDCPSFSCGPLRNVSSPFRQSADPPWCGYQSYELVCSDNKAAIRMDSATYYVSVINYSDSTFWVVDADLDPYCPLPQRSPYRAYQYNPGMEIELDFDTYGQATFVKCSHEVKGNRLYKHVACLSTNASHVYVLIGCEYEYMSRGSLEPSCGYLSMVQISGEVHVPLDSYEDVVKFMRSGFAVRFPYIYKYPRMSIKECLPKSSQFREQPIPGLIEDIYLFPGDFLSCALAVVGFPSNGYVELVIWILTLVPCIAVLCRFVLAPLAVLIFLAYKYWKTIITVDAVEKFLQMQQMLGPTRYAYTDITAITGHFRDKLGQGGYGSVYKGVLLPGNVHVAVKMLEGSSNCNGEDFICEVSTIGRIHHINVVRLVGFCSEQMRRALIYEYMPRGSLDKYIFSAENIFSWDKLNEIALGIASGINYVHQGCNMQILHFDIKPHNILLDSNFVPKVADFGLAKLCPRGDNFVPLSALRGTIGYIAPEMISRSFGAISSKSDVYSFGMLLLEMAGGRRNADPNAANSSQSYYPSWVYDRLSEQEVCEIFLVGDMHELEKKLCIIGLWCIQMRSHDRPTMSEVIEMLEGGADSLQMPSRPFFCDEGHTHVEDSYHLVSELTTISEEDE
ncbi:hypothetical protein ACQ4PT_008031 [Festuca glaucescens]